MRKQWSKEEVQVLLDSYESQGPKLLSRVLNRTMSSVSKKARSLGLKRSVAVSNMSRKNSWEFKEWSYDLGYVVGAYLGDGNIWTKDKQVSYFRLNVIDKDFCEAVRLKLKRITGYESSIKWYDSKKIWCLTFSNKDFVSWLRDNFGGAKEKRIVLLPNKESNKGMIEGLFDSEGTVTKYCFCCRMSGNLRPLQYILYQQLEIKKGPLNRGGHQLKYNNLFNLTVSNKEYTKVGLGTYIKRKAKNGILYKTCDYRQECNKDS